VYQVGKEIKRMFKPCCKYMGCVLVCHHFL